MFLQNLAQNLFDYDKPETEGEVIFYKLFEAFIIGYVIHLTWYWGLYIERISEVVLPLGLAVYIDPSFMFDSSLPIWNAVIITVLAVAGFFRISPKITYSVAMLLFHWQHVTRFTLGEIPHSANLIGMTFLGFAIAHVCFNEQLRIRRFSLGFMYFFAGLGYTSAAFSKLIGTGITWADGRHLWMWMSEKSVDIISRTGDWAPNFLQTLAFDFVWIATIILLIGWITELIGVAMWYKKYRSLVITLIIGMHIGITMTMNIRFDAFVAQLILMGYRWDKLIDYGLARARSMNFVYRFSKRFA